MPGRRRVRTPLIDRPRPARDDQLKCATTGRRAHDRNWWYVQRCVLPIHDGPHVFEWDTEQVLDL